MFSTSCPTENLGIRKCESECKFVGINDWINLKHQSGLVKSEDNLSLISGEFDYCPEFEYYNDGSSPENAHSTTTFLPSRSTPTIQNDDPTVTFSQNNTYDCEDNDLNNPINYEILDFDGCKINGIPNDFTVIPSDIEQQVNTSSPPTDNKTSSSSSPTQESSTSISTSKHYNFSRYKRRGSEISALVMNKIHQKFYSIRLGDWLKVIKEEINPKKSIYLLGKIYNFNNGNYANLMGKKEFLLDFSSRFWFTYRRNFTQLPCPNKLTSCQRLGSNNSSSNSLANGNSPVKCGVAEETVYAAGCPSLELRTSDCGWGCMLRSGQMILAQALSLHYMSRDWTITNNSSRDKAFHRQIIKWFGDTPQFSTSPFSIHRIVELSCHTPGDWFGPHSICCALQKTLHDSRHLHPKLQSVEIYLAADRTIYVKDVQELMKPNVNSDEPNFKCGNSPNKSVVILVPVQLGSDTNINSVYQGVMRRWLRNPCCLGIIGGRPKHSIYIVGYQEKNVIYLDPHLLQDTINVNQDNFSSESYHCPQPNVMRMTDLDPSCAVGFYCQDVGQLNQLMNQLQEISTIYIQHRRDQHKVLARPVIEVNSGHSIQTNVQLNISTKSSFNEHSFIEVL